MTSGDRPEINLLDGEFYVNSPYDTFAWLRNNEPIFWDAKNELWGVSRYDDIVSIERDKKKVYFFRYEEGGLPAQHSSRSIDNRT